MIRKTLIYGALLAMLSSPCAAQTVSKADADVRKDIHSLEMRIAERAQSTYKKIETDRFITYENPSACLDKNTEASVVIVYDKIQKSYKFFSMNVHSLEFKGKRFKSMQTIEQHFDDGLNGYDPKRSQSDDLFNEYSITQRTLPRENKLSSMSHDEIYRTNQQLKKGLMQLDRGCAY
jgi:hypothetical protein